MNQLNKKISKVLKYKLNNRSNNLIPLETKLLRNKNNILKQPQIKGVILKVYNITPKKPNSALRKVAKVFIKKLGKVIAYIPGEKHSINVHNEVLICKGKIQDLVNVNYKIIRGPLDAKFPIRSTSRSKYGTPRSILKK